MRRWLPFVLVLLLSLRGLVGDAMAGQMLAQQLATPPSAPAAAARMMAGHDCDSHGHEQAASAQLQAGEPLQAGDASQAPQDCPTCASCQVCSSHAMSASPVVAPALPAARSQPQRASAAYPSAEPALAFKPPRG